MDGKPIPAYSQIVVSAVGGAIATSIRDGNGGLLAIGVGAAHRMVRAIAVARGYLVADGLDIVCAPSVELKVNADVRMGLRFQIGLPTAALPPGWSGELLATNMSFNRTVLDQ